MDSQAHYTINLIKNGKRVKHDGTSNAERAYDKALLLSQAGIPYEIVVREIRVVESPANLAEMRMRATDARERRRPKMDRKPGDLPAVYKQAKQVRKVRRA